MSFLSEDDFFRAVEEISGKVLNKGQREAISFPPSPLKVVAGPGSGKTEVLVLRALYFMAVKGFPPKSIFLVSFTRKAAQELLTRIVSYAGKLRELFPNLKLEPYELYCGTLHSLCARVMDEFHYEKYAGYGLVDDFERELFIYREFRKEVESGKGAFFEHFRGDREQTPLERLHLLSFLFDFLTQNLISLQKLLNHPFPAVAQAGELYKKYLTLVRENRFLDHALLERMFLKFLKSSQGELFLKGDGTDYFPGLRAVLVDEYQDTNPLDEKIYFTLASQSKNLTVVGDDYQSLYRFRGAVVECFIDFERRCKRELKVEPKRVELFENYRSDKSIVAYLNYFMKKHSSHGELRSYWESLSTSKKLLWHSGIDSYREVKGAIFEVRGSKRELAHFTFKLLKTLKEKGVIEDYSDAVLLLPTTRERNFKGEKTLAAFVRELFEGEGIGIYNPRSKAFKEREEVVRSVGALLEVVPRPLGLNRELLSQVEGWESGLKEEELSAVKGGLSRGELSLLEAFYRIVPLLGYEGEVEKFNLARLSQLLFSVESLARKEVERWSSLEEDLKELSKRLKVELEEPEGLEGEEREKWLKLTAVRLLSYQEFYNSFLPLLVEGDVDQEELPQIPPGHFPLMTIHQSKGLEFPIVLVGEVGSLSSDYKLSKFEELFESFLPYGVKNSWAKAAVEAVKRFFVAYSRAIYALIILAEDSLKHDGKRPWKSAAFPGFDHGGNKKFLRAFKRKVEGEP